jgi:hypothetical protein
MTAVERVLCFVNVFAAAIVAGGQVVVLLVIIPTKRRFATRVSVEVHNAMLGHQIDRFMKPAGIVSMATAVAILVLHLLNVLTLSRASVAAYLVGIVGTTGVIIMSRFFNVPTNRMMEQWSLDAIPENYPMIRDRWDLVHTIRDSFGVLALTGYLAAALLR